jgi:hypothetical protein
MTRFHLAQANLARPFTQSQARPAAHRAPHLIASSTLTSNELARDPQAHFATPNRNR